MSTTNCHLAVSGRAVAAETVALLPAGLLENLVASVTVLAGMVEAAAGRVLIAMQEGCRTPGNIRGWLFRVTPGVSVPAASRDEVR